jgi:hypothetical protein
MFDPTTTAEFLTEFVEMAGNTQKTAGPPGTRAIR